VKKARWLRTRARFIQSNSRGVDSRGRRARQSATRLERDLDGIMPEGCALALASFDQIAEDWTVVEGELDRLSQVSSLLERELDGIMPKGYALALALPKRNTTTEKIERRVSFKSVACHNSSFSTSVM
jgi:hypothetical protein